MTIKINGRDYNFELNGTVGIAYLAQKVIGEDNFDHKNIQHHLAMLYTAFYTSNSGVKDLPNYEQFLASLTSKSVSEMTNYFWQRWEELEGPAPKEEKQGED